MIMKFKTYSLGCKVNIYEVEAISSDLIKSGFELTNNDEEADVIIINTCTVTSTSDSKSRQLIRKIRKLNEKAIIVDFCSCVGFITRFLRSIFD